MSALAGMLLSGLAYGVLVSKAVARNPTEESVWIDSVLRIKEAAVSTSAKILLVGGSNVHFGLLAERIEAITGQPTVNFGTHAGLGVSYVLSRAERVVRRGDVVAIALEYEFFEPEETTQVLASYLRSFDGPDLRSRPFRDQIRIESMVTVKDIMQAYAPSPGFKIFESETNRWGDEMNNVEARRPESRWLVATAQRPGSTFAVIPDARRIPSSIAAFIDASRKKGATVVAAWPSLVDTPTNRGPKAKATWAIIRDFYKSHGVAVLGSPEDELIAPDQVFDAIYHPVRPWSDARSERLAAELRPVLQESGKPGSK